MSRLYVQIAEFSMEGGKRQERGYNVRVISPAPDTPEAAKGTLVMLLDLTGPSRHRRRYLRQLMNTIQSTYYASTGPILAALEHALRMAHHDLLAINEALEETEDRYLCHAACLVIHEDEVFMVQVGASTVAILFPSGVKWFSPLESEEEDPVPLGMDRIIRPLATRVTVPPGTMILVLDSGWLGQMDPDLFVRAISHPTPEEVLEELARAVQVPDVSALAVKLEESHTVPSRPTPTYAVVEEPEEEEGLGEEDIEVEEEDLQREPLFSRLSEQVRSLAGNLLPGREAEAPPSTPMPAPPPIERPPLWPLRRRATRGRRSWRRTVWLAIVLLPLLIILITTLVWWRQGQQQEARYQAAVEQARTALELAASENDEDTARAYLRQAERALQIAAEIHPGSPEIERLRLDLQEQRYAVEQIKPLYLMWRLMDWNGNDARVWATDEHVYILDKVEDVLYRFALEDRGEAVREGSQEVLMKRGDVVQGKTLGDLVDIAWLPAGVVTPASGILTLDGAGALFLYDGIHGVVPVALHRPDLWRSPLRMIVYMERLYILDPQAGTIFRYLPTPEGYIQPPESYFATSTNVRGVQDMAIDGYVYLLFPDGRLLRYFGGEQDSFAVETAFSQPTALFTSVDNAYLYVADAGNGRMVVLNKETGTFVVQLIPGEGLDVDFSEIQSIFVTEGDSAIYILTRGALWRAPLGIQ